MSWYHGRLLETVGGTIHVNVTRFSFIGILFSFIVQIFSDSFQSSSW